MFLKESNNQNNNYLSLNSNCFSSIIYFNDLITSNENFNENKSVGKLIHSNIFRDHIIIGSLSSNIIIEYNHLFVQKKIGIRNEDNIGFNFKFYSSSIKNNDRKSLDIENLENYLEELKTNFYEENDFYQKFTEFLDLLKINLIKYEEEIFIIQNLQLKIMSKLVNIIDEKIKFECNKFLKLIILILNRKEFSLKFWGYDSIYRDLNSQKNIKNLDYNIKNIKLKNEVSLNFIKVINKLIIFIKNKLNVF